MTAAIRWVPALLAGVLALCVVALGYHRVARTAPGQGEVTTTEEWVQQGALVTLAGAGAGVLVAPLPPARRVGYAAVFLALALGLVYVLLYGRGDVE